MTEAAGRLRIDKWLWHARFFKTRSMAARVVSEGRVRLNAERILKPAQPVAAGDVVTFPQADRVRVVRITALGTRRGPAPEAQTLYDEVETASGAPASPGYEGRGRPTKKDRRSLPGKGDLPP